MLSKKRLFHSIDKDGKAIIMCSGDMPDSWLEYFDEDYPFFDQSDYFDWQTDLYEATLITKCIELQQFFASVYNEFSPETTYSLKYRRKEQLFCSEIDLLEYIPNEFIDGNPVSKRIGSISIMVFDNAVDAIHFKLTIADTDL
jgi:hypothetical protein